MDRKTGTRLLCAITLAFLVPAVLAGCAASKADTSAGGPGAVNITAAKVDAAPVIDGRIDEAAWKRTSAVVVPLRGEAGVEARTVSLKALSDGTNIYIAASYKDTTPRKMNLAWEYDGAKWARGSYDDSLSLVWNINDSVPGFNTEGLNGMTTDLHQGTDIFDFTLTPKDDAAAAAEADYWGW